MGIVIFLSLGNHSRSFSNEDHHAPCRYQSTCATTDHLEQLMKTNQALSCQWCEDLVAIES
ncbi:MAG: hypothetical protein CMN21_22000 [Rubinisphaera sp.]|nr:hypothetical protein [Rubinisphaera sp.]